MTERLASLIRQICTRRDLEHYDEATTQQTVILPILQTLGWDVFDPREVTPQYPVKSYRVDYALIAEGDRKVLCEVKKPAESDLSKHEEELVGYAFREGAELAVLTNGVSWWFYLPMLGIPWEQRKFLVVDVRDQPVEDVARCLYGFLSKDRVRTGQAKREAERLHHACQRTRRIETTLPTAWQALIEEQADVLVEMLRARTEKMCGLKPTADQTRAFLSALSGVERVEFAVPSTRGNPRRSPNPPRSPDEVEGRITAMLRTPQERYGPLIIEAVRAHGGRAYFRDVINWLYRRLTDEFLPGDLRLHRDGYRVWENSVYMERQKMVRAGILKEGPARGIWELA